MTQSATPVDPLVADLDVIAVAQRILTNRIAELEAELARQAAVTETLRRRLADALHENQRAAAEVRTTLGATGERLAAVQATADARARELASLRDSRVMRWSAPARRVYRRLRAMVGR